MGIKRTCALCVRAGGVESVRGASKPPVTKASFLPNLPQKSQSYVPLIPQTLPKLVKNVSKPYPTLFPRLSQRANKKVLQMHY